MKKNNCNCFQRLAKNIDNPVWLDELAKLYSTPHFNIGAEGTTEWQKYMDYVLSYVKLDGIWMEFGVWAGRTIKYIASQAPRIVYGFDSFQGLNEKWGNLKKGRFDRRGIPPKVFNTEFFVGYFEDSLPKFVQQINTWDEYEGDFTPCAFIHIDSDLYSSAKTILTELKDRIDTGTVIAFDDFHNWECCLEGEFKALLETDFEWKYIAHTSYVQGSVIIQ